jgi:hypothetical protein
MSKTAAPPANKLVSVRDARDRAIAILSDRFSKDELELDDLERRLNLVHTAASPAEVDLVLADLSGMAEAAKLPVPAAAPASSRAMVPASQVRERQSIVAIFGGAERKGAWLSPRHLRVVAVMGGVELDFRDARLPPGVTDVSIFSFMGGVEVLVPPELAVESNGVAIMGGFEHLDRAPAETEGDQPVLRVHGFVMMGGFSIETRLPGETSGDARRRRRTERKEQRRLLSGRR